MNKMKRVNSMSMKTKIFNKTQQMITGGKGRLATKHAHELLRIIDGVASSTEYTGERYWFGIAMDTGGGKSSIIAATALVTYEASIDYPMLVAVPNLQSMVEMQERLLKEGYPKDLIGKVFSTGAGSAEDRDALGGATPDHQLAGKKVLLICHQRMNHRDWAKYKKTDWGTRSCFWDEAIQYGESFSFPKEGTVMRLQRGAAFEHGNTACRDWFVESLGLVDGCMVGDLITLPSEVPDGIGYFIKQVVEDAQRRGLGGDWDDIEKLVATAGVDIRVADSDVLTFTYRFPDDLQNLFVLDAGHKHSELSQLDDRLVLIEAEPWKQYKHVTIYQGTGGTSKNYIEKNHDSVDFKGGVRKYLEMIGGEPFIVLTKKDYVPWLKADYGFTDDQIVTYGKEQGVNKHRDVKHVLVIGLNRIKIQEMEAKWLLYSRDAAADYSDARGYIEKAAMLQWYQGVSRTNLRNVTLDPKDFCVAQAGETSIYMTGSFKKDIESYTRTKLMPGCRVVEMTKGFDVVKRIEELTAGKDEITLRDLWREIEHPLNRSEKETALRAFLDEHPDWEKEGRTLAKREVLPLAA
jgi:hypothetical protein